MFEITTDFERLFFFKKFSTTFIELLFLSKIYLNASFSVKSKIFLLNSIAFLLIVFLILDFQVINQNIDLSLHIDYF